ncbi:MAG: anaerobic sulfatase maturase [Planctomycetes bacterium]|nr:anaerobic sulfatase maturase [Planctomycetota bacterium]
MFTLMAKPTCGICNLRCGYCYYLEKTRLYPDERRFRMSDEVLEAYVRAYLQAGLPVTSFAWQGGEPTLMGLPFFRKAVGLQRRHAPPETQVLNNLQTNGTLLDETWCAFLREENFLVGISIDGPARLHDAWRKDAAGRGSHARVFRGLECLRDGGVEFNALVLLNDVNVREPESVLDFLADSGVRHVQYIPCLNVDDVGRGGRGSIGAAAYGDFLNRTFDLWLRRYVGRVFIQTFEVTLANWLTGESPLCVFRKRCGRHMIVEYNGDVYACDHFVVPEWRLGNIARDPLPSLAYGARQDEFDARKEDLPAVCRACRWESLCHGGCPKHRIEGDPPVNAFCEAYRMFFSHTEPVFRAMAADLAAGRTADHALHRLGLTKERPRGRPGRNDPCPCGSGRKYKACCGRGDDVR